MPEALCRRYYESFVEAGIEVKMEPYTTRSGSTRWLLRAKDQRGQVHVLKASKYAFEFRMNFKLYQGKVGK